jgi:hypothetical protein
LFIEPHYIIANYTPDKLELILLNVLPITGPNNIRAAITTIATITKINAYSTSPWPFSFLENSIELHLLFCPEWETIKPRLLKFIIYYTFSRTDKTRAK